jgi:hypothetical protein
VNQRRLLRTRRAVRIPVGSADLVRRSGQNRLILSNMAPIGATVDASYFCGSNQGTLAAVIGGDHLRHDADHRIRLKRQARANDLRGREVRRRNRRQFCNDVNLVGQRQSGECRYILGTRRKTERRKSDV